ncbi:DUF1534 domain-containing protein [Pseudomonas caricapapayae]|nr:DUF1534 domain-containing protein [Pseudomonas caricapapayae]
MQFSTLCVARGRGASGAACDAERRTIVTMIVPTLQRGNAVLEAPRRKRTRSIRSGMRRRASHDSYDDRSYAPAWECSSRSSASQEDAERPERHATQSVAR